MVNKKIIRESANGYPGYFHPETTVNTINEIGATICGALSIENLYDLLLKNGNKETVLLNNSIIRPEKGKNVFIYDSLYRDYVRVVNIQKSVKKIPFEAFTFNYKDSIIEYESEKSECKFFGNIFVPTKLNGAIRVDGLKKNDYLFPSDYCYDVLNPEYPYDEGSSNGFGGIAVFNGLVKNDKKYYCYGYRIVTISGHFDVEKQIVVYDSSFLD